MLYCPNCHNPLFAHVLDPDFDYVRKYIWEIVTTMAIIAGENFVFSAYKRITERPDDERGRMFMRMHYLCKCNRCGFEWDLLLAGDWNKKLCQEDKPCTALNALRTFR